MSNQNAIRISDLDRIYSAGLSFEDLVEVVDMNGDQNGNPKSVALSMQELTTYVNEDQGYHRYNLHTFRTDDLEDNNSVKFNNEGRMERNSGFVILQADIQIANDEYYGELAIFMWTTDSSQDANTPSVSLFTSTDNIFVADTGPLGGFTGQNNKITFSVGDTDNNTPPFWVENRTANKINIRVNSF